MNLCCIDPKSIAEVWPVARHLIRSAIEETGLSDFADIEKDVLSGDQLLWLAISDRIEAAMTTHLIKTDNGLVLVITALAGAQRERWLSLKDRIENYARAEGCKLVRLYGRKGWQRVLPDYSTEHVVMEKVL